MFWKKSRNAKTSIIVVSITRAVALDVILQKCFRPSVCIHSLMDAYERARLVKLLEGQTSIIVSDMIDCCAPNIVDYIIHYVGSIPISIYDPYTHCCISIPNKLVRNLIGRHGSTLKYIGTNSGCHILVERDDEADPSSHTRKIQIFGSSIQISKGLVLISSILARAESLNEATMLKAEQNLSTFEQDSSTFEAVGGHSAGLFNLGNTCYMNSTLQCLHSVPELKSALLKYSVKPNELDQPSHLLTTATRDLFAVLDRNVKPVSARQFWKVLINNYPLFGKLKKGRHMQQDSNEFWRMMLVTLSQSLTAPDSRDTVKELFGIDLVSRVHCPESGEESSEAESVFSLKCHISQDVNHLHQGLMHGLKSEFEKVSPFLGRSAVYLKESRINHLPRYLTVKFSRFFWKSQAYPKAKIFQKVDYPQELDIYDLCSDELHRKCGEASTATPQAGSTSDKKVQFTGVYDLVAVLTHKGRSADSGHYIAWVKQENGKWLAYDDHKLIQHSQIPELSGGGDGQMAYICLYRARC